MYFSLERSFKDPCQEGSGHWMTICGENDKPRFLSISLWINDIFLSSDLRKECWGDIGLFYFSQVVNERQYRI